MGAERERRHPQPGPAEADRDRCVEPRRLRTDGLADWLLVGRALAPFLGAHRVRLQGGCREPGGRCPPSRLLERPARRVRLLGRGSDQPRLHQLARAHGAGRAIEAACRRSRRRLRRRALRGWPRADVHVLGRRACARARRLVLRGGQGHRRDLPRHLRAAEGAARGRTPARRRARPGPGSPTPRSASPTTSSDRGSSRSGSRTRRRSSRTRISSSAGASRRTPCETAT